MHTENHKNKASRIFDNLLIATFVIGLSLPLVLTHNRKESATEKRKLAEFPQLKWEHQTMLKFPSQFESFFNDHFGLRDQLTQVYSLYSIILKNSSNPKVLIGLNDWLFYVNPAEGNSLEDYRRNDPFTPEELRSWKIGLEAKHKWLKQQGIPYLFVVVPDKYSIYPEYMPEHIRQVGRQTRLDQLVEYMKDSEVTVLDLRPTLLAAKQQGQLFYKTDTHWNDFGAAIAQHEIIRTIQKVYPNLTPNLSPINYSWQDFGLIEYKSGDIANMLNISYFLKEMVPELRKALPICDKQIVEKHPEDQMKATFFTDCRIDAPKALIFRDSFFIALQPYISQYFAKTVYVWEWPDIKLIEKYVQTNQPDIVIEARVERHLKFIKPQ